MSDKFESLDAKPFIAKSRILLKHFKETSLLRQQTT